MAQPPGSPSAGDFFSDLRGVTVRNTFLEFADTARDDFFPDSGFARQASEPAKSMNQDQVYSSWVDELTGGSAAGTPTPAEKMPEEAEEGDQSAQLRACLAPSGGSGRHRLPSAGAAGSAAGGRPSALTGDLSAFGVDGGDGAAGMAAMSFAAPMSAAPLVAMPRFCPNCGAEVEPKHRFCPYCCFQLHNGGCGGGAAAPAGDGGDCGGLEMPPRCAQAQPQPPCMFPLASGDARGGGGRGGMWQTAAGVGMGGSPIPTPNLLSSLRRFRYVEASPEDVNLARAICFNMMQEQSRWA